MLEMGLTQSLCDPPVQTFDSGQGGSQSRLSPICWRRASPNLCVTPLFRPRTLDGEDPSLPDLSFSGLKAAQQGILTLLRKQSLIDSGVLNGISTKLSI